MCCISKIIVKLLLIIGALNWGVLGFFQVNLIATWFGGDMGEEGMAARVIFALVGIAGLLAILCWVRCCKSGGCSCGCKSCCKKK